MSNGKGSQRRPRVVSREEYERTWDAVFKNEHIGGTLDDFLDELETEVKQTDDATADDRSAVGDSEQ